MDRCNFSMKNKIQIQLSENLALQHKQPLIPGWGGYDTGMLQGKKRGIDGETLKYYTG